MKNWIPTNSYLPKDGESVLVYTNDKETKIVNFTSYLTSSISHWMKLPNPPHYNKIYNICLKEFKKLQAKNISNLDLKTEFISTLETEVEFKDITEIEYNKGLEFMDRIVQEIEALDEVVAQS